MMMMRDDRECFENRSTTLLMNPGSFYASHNPELLKGASCFYYGGGVFVHVLVLECE